MAITLVSGNLNLYGDAGQFEADRSTWGFGDVSSVIVRSSVQKTAGLYSAFISKPSTSGNSLLIPYRFGISVGKKYRLSANVFVPSGNPVGLDADVLTFTPSLDNFIFGLDDTSHVNKTVLEAKDAWVNVAIFFDCDDLGFSGGFGGGFLRIAGTGINNGKIYVDQMEVYEYVITPDDPDPDPDPTPPPPPFDKAYFSKNPIVLEKTSPVGWDILTNFRLYDDVRVEEVNGSGTYNSKLKIELPPASDGKAIFYVRQAFRGILIAIPPAVNFSDIVQLTDRIKLFKHFTGQLQDDEVTPGVLTDSSPLLVLLGGINKQKYPGLNYFTGYLPANKKFMSWAPVEKIVDRLQEDYLNFWIYNADITGVKLNIKAYYDDGTDETQIVATLTPVFYGSLIQIPAGPTNSGVADIDPSKTLTKYELSLLDQADSLISEVRTYKISEVHHPLTRFIMFLNSLGTYEVILFVGQAQFQTDFDREVIQKFLPHDYTVQDGEFEVNNTSLQEKVNFSTGYLTGQFALAWQRYMKDLILSSRIFDVTSGSRIPVTCTSNTLDGGLDQEYVRFARLDTQKAFVDDSFTPDDI